MRKALALGAASVVLAALVAASSVVVVGAQEPTEVTIVVSDIEVDPSISGAATIPIGTDDGVVGAACTGNSPLGGTAQHPGQVISELRATTIALRIHNVHGAQVSGIVQLNCALDVLLPPTLTVEKLRAKVKGLA